MNSPEHRRRELAGQHQRLAGQPGREVVERVAGGQHGPLDAGGALADEQLDQGAAGVVADHGDVVQVQALEELRDQPRHPGQRTVGVGPHRGGVGAQRQRRHHAAMVDAEVSDHRVPQRSVHQQPVQQHHHRPVAAGVLVLDRPGRQLDRFRGHPPPLSPGLPRRRARSGWRAWQP
jgi:hypothetical protein